MQVSAGNELRVGLDGSRLIATDDLIARVAWCAIATNDLVGAGAGPISVVTCDVACSAVGV